MLWSRTRSALTCGAVTGGTPCDRDPRTGPRHLQWHRRHRHRADRDPGRADLPGLVLHRPVRHGGCQRAQRPDRDDAVRAVVRAGPGLRHEGPAGRAVGAAGRPAGGGEGHDRGRTNGGTAPHRRAHVPRRAGAGRRRAARGAAAQPAERAATAVARHPRRGAGRGLRPQVRQHPAPRARQGVHGGRAGPGHHAELAGARPRRRREHDRPGPHQGPGGHRLRRLRPAGPGHGGVELARAQRLRRGRPRPGRPAGPVGLPDLHAPAGRLQSPASAQP